MAKFDEALRNEWIDRFEEQKDRIQNVLFDGETIKQMLDEESFDGRFYNPMWVITSEARIWSLAKNNNHGGLLIPKRSQQGRRNRAGEYTATRRWYEKNIWPEVVEKVGVTSMAQLYYHQMVANYFCDKKAVEIFGESSCVAHHIFRYRELVDEGIVNTKEEDCTWNNRAKHLRWVSKADHAVLTFIQNSWYEKKTIDYILDQMMKGIHYKDRYTKEEYTVIFEGSKEYIYQGYKEILENGAFYEIMKDENGNIIRDENGDALKRDQWTALWCEYKDDGEKSMKVKGFWYTGNLPYNN